jgi:hypothetical protein
MNLVIMTCRSGKERALIKSSVPDPDSDPPDPHVFGPPGEEEMKKESGRRRSEEVLT